MHMHCYAKGKSLLKLDELKDQACKRLRDVYFKLLHWVMHMKCYQKRKSLLNLAELKDQACKRLRDVYFKLAIGRCIVTQKENLF